MTDRVSELKLFFSTPVWISRVKNHQEVNKKILEYIKSLESQNPKGVQKSNSKGWHSQDFDLNANNIKDYINSIGPYINETLIDMGWDLKNQKVKITSMWSIINRNDATNARHIHSNNYISAAYYVKAPENCGNIVFHDPRSEPVYFHPRVENPNNLNTNIVSIKPEEGLLVLFPSYLHHSVDVNRSNEDRIVISFNINLS